MYWKFYGYCGDDDDVPQYTDELRTCMSHIVIESVYVVKFNTLARWLLKFLSPKLIRSNIFSYSKPLHSFILVYGVCLYDGDVLIYVRHSPGREHVHWSSYFIVLCINDHL